MIRKRYVFVSLLALLCALSPFAYAHTYKVSAIIDTDMALDDIRALAMVLNSDWIDVPLIVCSDGAVSPQTGYRNLKILLKN